nr:hypothetical protein Iba_chr05bCG6960 [Ipomoea batatas]
MEVKPATTILSELYAAGSELYAIESEISSTSSEMGCFQAMRRRNKILG